MRLLGIVVNLAQIGLILAVFFAQGLSLGGYLILAMFWLLIFAFVNLLVLMFYTSTSETEQPLIDREKPALIKRRDLRVGYALGPKPDLVVGKQSYPVLDLAENGLRISISRGGRFRKRFRGRIRLLCGQTLAVKGTLVRREGTEAALALKHPVEFSLLMEEKKSQESQSN